MTLTEIVNEYVMDPTEENKEKFENAYKNASSVTILTTISDITKAAVANRSKMEEYTALANEMLTYVTKPVDERKKKNRRV